MEAIYSYLREATRVENLEPLPWKEIVDNIILPQLAYRAEQRNRIGDGFMKFMAEFAREVCDRDGYLGEIMLEIAMQRISDGAVVHQDDPTPTFNALPAPYKTYGSQNMCQGGEPGLMGKECFDFIVKALPVCLERPQTKSHALAIAFGLVRYLAPNGEPLEGYMLGHYGYKPDGKALYALAKQWVENYATEEELFRHYAQPAQWKKHSLWFSKLANDGLMDWKKFFAATQAAGNGNFFQRWLQRKKVKKEIAFASQSAAR